MLIITCPDAPLDRLLTEDDVGEDAEVPEGLNGVGGVFAGEWLVDLEAAHVDDELLGAADVRRLLHVGDHHDVPDNRRPRLG